jgi:hypothetical protein
VAGFISEWWPASNRNGGRLQIGIGGRIASEFALDRLLARQRANKSELLMVLERPEIPLNTNGSENDVRCQVTKRKISGGTRSDAGRDCRDGFLGLLKTCGKNGIEFWDYLGARLKVPGCRHIPALAEIVSARAPRPP